MMITVEFMDFDDMVLFARRLTEDMPASTAQAMPVPVQPMTMYMTPQQPAQEMPAPQAPVQPDEDDTPAAPGAENTVYKLIDVRGLLSKLTKAGKKAQVQELIKSFGVDKLSQIPEDKYPEVMKKAGEL